MKKIDKVYEKYPDNIDDVNLLKKYVTECLMEMVIVNGCDLAKATAPLKTNILSYIYNHDEDFYNKIQREENKFLSNYNRYFKPLFILLVEDYKWIEFFGCQSSNIKIKYFGNSWEDYE